jgi:ribose 5-phosphate isomerase B
MRLGIGADHGGFDMKNELAKLLVGEDHQIVDFGNKVYDANDDYPDFAISLALAVAHGDVDRGILVSGSGMGVSIVANKIAGVRAAICHDIYSANQGVEDDDVNILCFGARTTALALAWDCTKQFLNAKFRCRAEDCRRLAKLLEIERNRRGGAIADNHDGILIPWDTGDDEPLALKHGCS